MSNPSMSRRSKTVRYFPAIGQCSRGRSPGVRAVERCPTAGSGPGGRPGRLMLVVGKVWQQILDRPLGFATPSAELHQSGVECNAVKPGEEFGPAVEPVQPLDRGQKRVLDGVARVFVVTQNAAGDRQQRPAARTDERRIGGPVTGPQGDDEGGFLRRRIIRPSI